MIWCINSRAKYDAKTFRIPNSRQYVKKLEALTAFLSGLELDCDAGRDRRGRDQHWVCLNGCSSAVFPVALALAGAPRAGGKFYLSVVQQKIDEIIVEKEQKSPEPSKRKKRSGASLRCQFIDDAISETR